MMASKAHPCPENPLAPLVHIGFIKHRSVEMACVLEPGVDQATADLIVQLQLEDAGCYFESSKSRTRELTDEELAFQLQNEELENVSQFLVVVLTFSV